MMNELEVRTVVENLIADHNLAAHITECESDETHFGNDFWTVKVGVDRKDYERASLMHFFHEKYSVSWMQNIPELVAAEVGDLVLIYSDHCADDSKSHVGFVSSKFVKENGDVCYGCRYINISLNNSFVSSVYDFELTTENYGGFPTGFLKVLTPQEALNHLLVLLDMAYKDELEAVHKRFNRSVEKLPQMLNFLASGQKIKCDKIELGNSPWNLSVKTQ